MLQCLKRERENIVETGRNDVYEDKIRSPVINRGVCMRVLEIKRVDDQSPGQLETISYPETGTVEIRKEKFVRICVERIRVFYSSHEWLQLWTYEGVSRVGGVHVEPNLSTQ